MDLFDVGDGHECLTLELFVQVGRLLKRFSFEDAAEAVGIPEAKLRSFYNRVFQAGWNRRPEFREEVKRQEEAGEDWILARYGEKPRFRFIDLKTIRAGLERNDEAWAIAMRHELDYNDFAKWLGRYQDDLRKERKGHETKR